MKSTDCTKLYANDLGPVSSCSDANKDELLGAKVTKTASLQGSRETEFDLANKCADALQSESSLFSNKEVNQEELIQMAGMQEDFIVDSFLPGIFAKAHADAPTETSAQDKVPGRIIVKHLFFALKDAEDARATARKNHAAAQRQFAKHRDIKVFTMSKKRKSAEMECERITVNDEVTKEIKLARRNQINRKRKNITKVKKKRSEDHLPEAHSWVCKITYTSYVTRVSELPWDTAMNESFSLRFFFAIPMISTASVVT